MKFIYKLSFILFFIFSICSCNFQTETTVLLGEIKPFSTLAENQQFVTDVLAYDHATLMKEKLNLTDSTILNGINYETESTAIGVKFKLTLTGSAMPYTKEIGDYFINFFDKKEKEYKEKSYRVRQATATAGYFIDLLNEQKYSNMWLLISSEWKEITTKEQFVAYFKELEYAKEIRKGEKQLQSRVLQNKIRNFVGEFYVVNYIHSEKYHIQIVLQPIGDEMVVSIFVIKPI